MCRQLEGVSCWAASSSRFSPSLVGAFRRNARVYAGADTSAESVSKLIFGPPKHRPPLIKALYKSNAPQDSQQIRCGASFETISARRPYPSLMQPWDRRNLTIPQLLRSNVWAIVPLVMKGPATVLTHRGLSPHQFTPNFRPGVDAAAKVRALAGIRIMPVEV